MTTSSNFLSSQVYFSFEFVDCCILLPPVQYAHSAIHATLSKSESRVPLVFNVLLRYTFPWVTIRGKHSHTHEKELSLAMCNAHDIVYIYHHTLSLPPSSGDSTDGTGDTAVGAAIARAASSLSFKLSASPQSNLEHRNDPNTFSGSSLSSSP